MSVLASIWTDFRKSVVRQRTAVRLGDEAIRAVPDFRSWTGSREKDPGAEPLRLMRRGRVVVRTEAEPAVATAWAIAQNVRMARLRARLTQEELAERTGMARPNIARIESGRHVASTDTLRRVAKALGVAMAALLAAQMPGLDEDDLTLAASGVAEWSDSQDREDGA